MPAVVVTETRNGRLDDRGSALRKSIPETPGNSVGIRPSATAIALSTLVFPCALSPCSTVSDGLSGNRNSSMAR